VPAGDRIGVVKAALVFAIVVTIAGQAPNPQPQDIVKEARPLQQAEVAAVLGAARAAIAGKTVRLAFAPDGPGPDVLFGSDGRGRIVRTVSGTTGGIAGGDGARSTWHTAVETISEYTRRPARGCDGAARPGELVIEYSNENDKGWNVRARTTPDHDIAAPIFEMLSGTVAAASGNLGTFGERKARAIVAPWTPPAATITVDAIAGDPRPSVTPESVVPRGSQTLWIDVDSLRPIRWAVTLPGLPSYALTFTYDTSPAPKIPDGLTPPACVP